MERTVDLGAEAGAFIDEAIQTGDYGSAEDVLLYSLSLLQERYEARHNFEQQITGSLLDAEAGRSTDAEEVFDRLDRKCRGMAKARSAA